VITHEYVDGGTSKTGWPICSMKMSTPILDKAAIEELSRHLIRQAGELVEKAVTDPDRLLQVEVEVGGLYTLSERILWRLVIETCSEAEDLVVAYIDALCDNVMRWPEERLFYNSEEYCAGSYALFAYLDYLFDSDKGARDRATNIYKAFLRYLRFCDLDHEVHQDDYICKVLDELSYRSGELYLELLHLRLYNGQYAIGRRDYEFFNRYVGAERFRVVLDYVVSKNDAEYRRVGSKHMMEDYLPIIASVYGSDRERTEEIVRYIVKRVQAPVVIPEDIMEPSRRMQLVCDAYRATARSTKGYLDSGFHKYDQQTVQVSYLPDTRVAGVILKQPLAAARCPPQWERFPGSR